MSCQICCPNCNYSTCVSEEFRGRELRCPDCEFHFPAGGVYIARRPPQPADESTDDGSKGGFWIGFWLGAFFSHMIAMIGVPNGPWLGEAPTFEKWLFEHAMQIALLALVAGGLLGGLLGATLLGRHQGPPTMSYQFVRLALLVLSYGAALHVILAGVITVAIILSGH